VLILYGSYELARDLVVGDARTAEEHARDVVSLERWLHLFCEADVQHVARSLPGLTGVLGTAYLSLHLAVTAFAFVRTTLLLASGISLIAFVAAGRVGALPVRSKRPPECGELAA
jgi:hypothetical protein